VRIGRADPEIGLKGVIKKKLTQAEHIAGRQACRAG